jgi:SAM-dependent methyltransferase
VSATLYGPEFFAGRSETVARSASAVAPIVYDIVRPRSMLDVGCGQGEWLEAFSLPDMLGVDIAAPEGESFLRHDLTVPLDLGRTFDLVVSLEVGEHLPGEAADTLVASIVRHAGTIMFSAAVLGQEGIGHINCQPHEYWHEKFAAHGYEVEDSVRPLIANNLSVSPWYRNNIVLYVR